MDFKYRVNLGPFSLFLPSFSFFFKKLFGGGERRHFECFSQVSLEYRVKYELHFHYLIVNKDHFLKVKDPRPTSLISAVYKIIT